MILSGLGRAIKLINDGLAQPNGGFVIKLLEVVNWDALSVELEQHVFNIISAKSSVLYFSAVYNSSIRVLTDEAKLLAMTDNGFGEIKDEYRYEADILI